MRQGHHLNAALLGHCLASGEPTPAAAVVAGVDWSPQGQGLKRRGPLFSVPGLLPRRQLRHQLRAQEGAREAADRHPQQRRDVAGAHGHDEALAQNHALVVRGRLPAPPQHVVRLQRSHLDELLRGLDGSSLRRVLRQHHLQGEVAGGRWGRDAGLQHHNVLGGAAIFLLATERHRHEPEKRGAHDSLDGPGRAAALGGFIGGLSEPHECYLQTWPQSRIGHEAEDLHEIDAGGNLVCQGHLRLRPHVEARLSWVLGLLERRHRHALLQECLRGLLELDPGLLQVQGRPVHMHRQHRPSSVSVVEDHVPMITWRQQHALHDDATA
mmetsp:Transcript_127698/g.322497  ORF Transcript_127698/g.322497 Transcript_127698/m.322497 type:complete len:325 (+) Transcript_127698:840-1814(+)